MAGKDKTFKVQYTIVLQGTSKYDATFDEFNTKETFIEALFKNVIVSIVEVHNSQYKTTKAKLEIKKIK